MSHPYNDLNLFYIVIRVSFARHSSGAGLHIYINLYVFFFRATKTRDIHAHKLIYRIMRSFWFLLRNRASRFEWRPRQFQDPKDSKHTKIPGNLKIHCVVVWYHICMCTDRFTVLRDAARNSRAIIGVLSSSSSSLPSSWRSSSMYGPADGIIAGSSSHAAQAICQKETCSREPLRWMVF